jgi:hypothetical protein
VGDRFNGIGVAPDYESPSREQVYRAATAWLKGEIATNSAAAN